jgi:flagellar basal body-associated protein FliL
MADKDKVTDEKDAVDEAQPKASAKKPIWKRLLSRRSLSIAAAVSVCCFALAMIYHMRSQNQTQFVSPEISLGEFEFASPDVAAATIAVAKFNLHIALLTEVDRQARLRFGARKFRVQQDIEELLRLARGGDFEDPRLEELKRQIQEQVNATLDMRAVSQVIVTDLELVKGGTATETEKAEEAEASDTAGTSPWKEKGEG